MAARFAFTIMHLTKSSRRKSNDKICSLLSIRQAFKKVTAQQKDQIAKIEGGTNT
jgi:hypothetical protein